jgi:hypothetical protein
MRGSRFLPGSGPERRWPEESQGGGVRLGERSRVRGPRPMVGCWVGALGHPNINNDLCDLFKVFSNEFELI